MSKPADRITVSRSKRGTTVKATGAAAQALFDALAGGSAVKTVHFEDHGQDFDEWDLDATGRVVACRPSQGWMWCRYRVVGPVEVGARLTVHDVGVPNGTPSELKYLVTKVVSLVAGG